MQTATDPPPAALSIPLLAARSAVLCTTSSSWIPACPLPAPPPHIPPSLLAHPKRPFTHAGTAITTRRRRRRKATRRARCEASRHPPPAAALHRWRRHRRLRRRRCCRHCRRCHRRRRRRRRRPSPLPTRGRPPPGGRQLIAYLIPRAHLRQHQGGGARPPAGARTSHTLADRARRVGCVGGGPRRVGTRAGAGFHARGGDGGRDGGGGARSGGGKRHHAHRRQGGGRRPSDGRQCRRPAGQARGARHGGATERTKEIRGRGRGGSEGGRGREQGGRRRDRPEQDPHPEAQRPLSPCSGGVGKDDDDHARRGRCADGLGDDSRSGRWSRARAEGRGAQMQRRRQPTGG